MLVIVHQGNIQFSLESLLDFEAFRRLDVFQVDAAKRGGYRFYCLDKTFGIFFIDFDVEDVDACIDLE
jgi:hypothetical protein